MRSQITGKSQTWCVDILPEVLEEIYKRLVLSDQIRFGCVCKAWFLTSEEPHPPVPEPWLMLGHGPITERNEFLCFSNKRVYKFDKIRKYCKVLRLSSSNGWVLTKVDPQFTKVGHTHTFILVNPILNFRFLLPKNSAVYSCYWLLKKLLVVRTRPSCGNSVVTILFLLYSTGRLVVCSQGYHEPNCRDNYYRGVNYHDIILHNGKIYALTSRRRGFEVHVLCLDAQTMCLRFLHIYFVQGIVTNKQEENIQTCLVESCGDLLIVRRQYNYHKRRSVGFEVFKLVTVDGLFHAAKLQSLRGQALFLGMDGCISLPVAKNSIFEENHVYFIGWISELCTEMEHCVYSPEDGSINPIPYLSSISGPAGSFWFVPTTPERIVNMDWANRN